MFWGVCGRTLSSNITELSESSVEKPVLLPEWFLRSADMSLLHLEFHVRVGHFWNVRDEKHKGKDEDKSRDAQVDPLNVLQSGNAVLGVFEEYVGSQHGANHGTDCVESLGKINPDLGVPRRSANRQVGVRGGFERAES